MSEPVTIQCHVCHGRNRVTPRLTVSIIFGGDVPIYDPLHCAACRTFLRPTPQEWYAVIELLAAAGEPILPQMWDRYAHCKAPLITRIRTA